MSSYLRNKHASTSNEIQKTVFFHYFNFQGHVSAGLILGGVDQSGSHIIQIHPYGSTAKLPYTTMGSGSLAAMSALEDGWKPDMTEEAVNSFCLLNLKIFKNLFQFSKM